MMASENDSRLHTLKGVTYELQKGGIATPSRTPETTNDIALGCIQWERVARVAPSSQYPVDEVAVAMAAGCSRCDGGSARCWPPGIGWS